MSIAAAAVAGPGGAWSLNVAALALAVLLLCGVYGGLAASGVARGGSGMNEIIRASHLVERAAMRLRGGFGLSDPASEAASAAAAGAAQTDADLPPDGAHGELRRIPRPHRPAASRRRRCWPSRRARLAGRAVPASRAGAAGLRPVRPAAAGRPAICVDRRVSGRTGCRRPAGRENTCRDGCGRRAGSRERTRVPGSAGHRDARAGRRVSGERATDPHRRGVQRHRRRAAARAARRPGGRPGQPAGRRVRQSAAGDERQAGRGQERSRPSTWPPRSRATGWPGWCWWISTRSPPRSPPSWAWTGVPACSTSPPTRRCDRTACWSARRSATSRCCRWAAREGVMSGHGMTRA